MRRNTPPHHMDWPSAKLFPPNLSCLLRIILITPLGTLRSLLRHSLRLAALLPKKYPGITIPPGTQATHEVGNGTSWQ